MHGEWLCMCVKCSCWMGSGRTGSRAWGGPLTNSESVTRSVVQLPSECLLGSTEGENTGGVFPTLQLTENVSTVISLLKFFQQFTKDICLVPI